MNCEQLISQNINPDLISTFVNIHNTDADEDTNTNYLNNYLKRKLLDVSGEVVKKMRTLSTVAYLYIPPSPKYNSGSETQLSVQGYETAYAKDTSDDPWTESDEEISENENILAVEEAYDVEYEVQSDSSTHATCTDTDSDAENLLRAILSYTVTKADSDREFWADDSSDDSTTDVEISDSDKWKCNKCGSLNKPPMRYCFTCWGERHGWLPDNAKRQEHLHSRPRRHRKKRTKTDKNKNSLSNSDSQSLSQPTASQESVSSQGIASSSSQEFEQSSEKAKLCILCCVKPMNASVIHGKIGHQFSCYRCARKLLSQKQPCPLCRRTIDRVVHQIAIESFNDR